ncbi:hypothetical protein R1sor_027135 [Riccia sorocarpa]|uniref:Reverse transcriptase domain-containing protein n=1 Tax=Riccia sorocarpa TaxID=122646 RepID=A0ABD3GF32_9MARC
MWTDAKDLCMEMLLVFWRDEQLPTPAKKGVIKLLAKNEEKYKLTNWRPITLQGITYKIISKILADSMKPLLPALVSGQQTGFVPERTIFDNILSVKLGEEWAYASEQPAIFLKNAAEILLLESTGKVKISKTLTHILAGWTTCKKKLNFHLGTETIHSQVPLEIGVRVREITITGQTAGWAPLKQRLKTMRLSYTGELQGDPLNRLLAADKLGVLPDSHLRIEGPVSKQAGFITQWATNASEEGKHITTPNLWRWEGRDTTKENKTWDMSTGEWRKLVRRKTNMWGRMNASWGCVWDLNKWETFWKRLWQSKFLPRDKLKVKHNWEKICQMYNEVTGREVSGSSLILVGGKLLLPENFSLALLFIKHTRFTWKDRCKEVYTRERNITPVNVVLVEAEYTIVGLRRKYTSESSRDKLENSHQEILLMKIREKRRRTRDGRVISPRQSSGSGVPGRRRWRHPARNHAEWIAAKLRKGEPQENKATIHSLVEGAENKTRHTHQSGI